MERMGEIKSQDETTHKHPERRNRGREREVEATKERKLRKRN